MRPFIILLLIFLISCQVNPNKNDLIVQDITINTVEEDSFAQTPGDYNSKNFDVIPYVWIINFEKKTKKRNAGFRESFLNVDTLINGLNILYPNIALTKIKIIGDTLFTEIKDSYYLGERMGSSGASAYIADVIINLTSVKNINFVNIDLDPGSHISPGTWGKREYRNYKEVR